MTVAFAAGLGEIPADRWDSLLAAQLRPSPFLSRRFLIPWHRSFGADCDVRVARWSRGSDADEGLLFLCRRGEGWGFLGSGQVADYLDALVVPGREEPFWREFLEDGLPAIGGGTLTLPGLVEGAASLSVLPGVCREMGIACAVEEMDRAPYVSLSGSFDDYLGRLGKKERHELRRKMRRSEELLPGIAYRVTGTPEELDRDLPSFIDLHRRSDPKKGMFMDDRMAGFFREVAEGFLSSGELRLAFLSGGGGDVASVFQFRTGGSLFLYNSGYHPSWRAANPGLVLIARCIERAAAEGAPEYDFLRGTERYKYDLGGTDRVVYRITVTR
ncbi:MAG: GNAT family N-acetyltransferase [Deltaproteobacteria bacterium]|nr:MAG: GNAT family N-acetyltransferase [Deltaproteobacteria bacterium]